MRSSTLHPRRSCRRWVRRAPLLLLAIGLLAAVPGPLAARTLTVTGVVLDPEESPLAGAEVALHPLGSRYEVGLRLLSGRALAEPAVRARTDAKGRFRIEAPEAGFWTVVARARGRVPMEYDLLPLLAPADLMPVALLPSVPVPVLVVDEAGDPVAGAPVLFQGTGPPGRSRYWRPWGWRHPGIRAAVTGPKGRASLPRFEAEGGTVVAAAVGKETSAEVSERPSSSLVRLVLAPAATRVVRAVGRDGRPVAGALVWSRGPLPPGRTGEDGTLAVPLDAGGSTPVRLDVPDGRVAGAVLEPATEEDTGPYDVVLEPRPEVAGRVVEAGGEGIGDALVWSPDDPAGAVRTGRDGSFRLPLPRPAGEVVVGAAAPGFLARSSPPFDAAGASTQAILLRLEPAAWLAGRVVEASGGPLPGATVRASPLESPGFGHLSGRWLRQARSGGDGRFSIDGLAAGSVLAVHVTLEGYAPWYERVAPATTGTEGRSGAPGYSELEVVLSVGSRVRGRLVDEAGVAVPGAQVVLVPRDMPAEPWSREPPATARAESGPDGEFELVDLAPGRADLAVRAAGRAPLLRPGISLPARPETVELGEIVLEPEAVLEGVVEDPRGVAVPGARVQVLIADPRSMALHLGPEEGERGSETGADGRWRVAGLRPGDTVEVQVWKEGFAPAHAAGLRLPVDGEVRTILEPAALVAGRVVDESGRGVHPANVFPSPQAGRAVHLGRPAQAEEDGSFVAELPAGVVQIVARAPGYRESEPVSLELAPGERREGVELVLRPVVVVRGRVLSPEGSPVAGARVAVILTEAGGVTSSSARPSDTDGRFEIETRPGRIRIEAGKEGWTAAGQDLELGPEGSWVELRLGRGNRVSGRVVGPEGQPVAGQRLQLGSGGSPFGSAPVQVSAADGTFVFESVADGSHRLRVLGEEGRYRLGAPAYVHPEPVVVGGAPVSGLLVRLPERATLRGRLLGVEPEELSRLTILAQGGAEGVRGGRRGAPLDGGGYEVTDVGPGRWEVSATVAGSGKSGHGTVEVAPGQAEARLDLELREGLTVTGTVRWNGEPVPGIRVAGATAGGSTGAVTGPDGRFELSGLAPGRQEITLGAPGTGAWVSRTVDIQGGEDLQLEIETARVRGTVLSAVGMEPLAEAAVVLRPQGADGRWGGPEGRAVTAADGSFLLDGLEAGSYRLRVEKPGYGAHAAPVVVTDREVTLAPVVLDPVAELELRVLTSGGAPVDRVWVTASGPDGTAVLDTWLLSTGGGRFFLETLPPGRWELLVRGGAGGEARVDVVSPGPPVTVVLAPAAASPGTATEPE